MSAQNTESSQLHSATYNAHKLFLKSTLTEETHPHAQRKFSISRCLSRSPSLRSRTHTHRNLNGSRQRQEAKKYQKNKKTNKNPATSQISPKNHSCQHCGGVIVTLKATEESALYITPKEYLITTTTTQESENKSPQT